MRKLKGDGLFWYQSPHGGRDRRGYLLKVRGDKFRFLDGDPVYYLFQDVWRKHMTPATMYQELFYGQD